MVKVFVVCSGLGNIQRGYESFTQECFDALSQDNSLDITLFKGGGDSGPRTTPLWNLPRNSCIANQLAQIASKSSKLREPYFTEQASFFLSLIPHIYLKKPDVIFFSDFVLGTMLWHWRRLSKLSYKLLFSNGAPNGPPFSRMDHVQHLTPVHYSMALDAGEVISKHSHIPYGIEISQDWNPPSAIERETIRQRLNLPINRPIILSVAAINRTHKRMDYLIREVAELPEPRPYLLLLGQCGAESLGIIQLGNELLGEENFQAKTVPSIEVSDYYKIGDLFVLASLTEGLPRVLLEAMSHGLPCLTHDYEIARFVLNSEGYYANFELKGSLTSLIRQVLSEKNQEANYRRHNLIYERFSWEKLRPLYTDMIYKCSALS
jgi:1,2-diacylglycerol 3-alpha-glucosyltransferase